MRAALLGILAILAPVSARADAPAEPPDPNDTLVVKPAVGKDIIVDTPGERSTSNIIILSSIAAAGAAFGGLGVYFHLDSSTQSNKVTAGSFTSRPWTPADQVAVDQAASDRTRAVVFYTAGGVLIIGAIVGLIVTEPSSERTVIHPHYSIAPAPGGGIVARTWSF